MKNIAAFLSISIDWIKRDELPEWFAFVDGETCELRMNDFPAEPLYTLEWQGQKMDLEQAPSSWSIPAE